MADCWGVGLSAGGWECDSSLFFLLWLSRHELTGGQPRLSCLVRLFEDGTVEGDQSVVAVRAAAVRRGLLGTPARGHDTQRETTTECAQHADGLSRPCAPCPYCSTFTKHGYFGLTLIARPLPRSQSSYNPVTPCIPTLICVAAGGGPSRRGSSEKKRAAGGWE